MNVPSTTFVNRFLADLMFKVARNDTNILAQYFLLGSLLRIMGFLIQVKQIVLQKQMTKIFISISIPTVQYHTFTSLPTASVSSTASTGE